MSYIFAFCLFCFTVSGSVCVLDATADIRQQRNSIIVLREQVNGLQQTVNYLRTIRVKEIEKEMLKRQIEDVKEQVEQHDSFVYANHS